MFSKLALLTAAAMAVFVAAGGSGSINNSCNTGEVQCCNQLFDATSNQATVLASLVGAVLGSVTGQVGASCSPLSVLAIAGQSCTQQPVCCTGNHYNGLVNVGCTPVNANL